MRSVAAWKRRSPSGSRCTAATRPGLKGKPPIARMGVILIVASLSSAPGGMTSVKIVPLADFAVRVLPATGTVALTDRAPSRVTVTLRGASRATGSVWVVVSPAAIRASKELRAHVSVTRSVAATPEGEP